MIELYYPSVTPKKDNWLKMAALYKPELYTINPSVYSYADYSYVNNDLDVEFLKQFTPMQNIDFENFERKIISLINILSNNASKEKFKYNGLDLDFSLKTNSKRSTLFNGKFTHEIKEAIIENRYGIVIDSNLYVSDIFITIYMGLLAQEIKNQNNEIILTAKDTYINRYQSLLETLDNGRAYLGDSNLRDMVQSQSSSENFYRHVISLAVPVNIKSLNFKNIQKIRTEDYIHDLRYFKAALDKIYIKNGGNNIEDLGELIREINEPLDNLKGRLKSQGIEPLLNLSFNYILSVVNPSFLLSETISNIFSTQLNHFINSGNHYTSKEWRGTLSVISTLDKFSGA